MKPSDPSPTSKATATGLVARSWEACITLFQARPLLIIGVVFCAGVVVVIWHLSRLENKLIESTATQNVAAHSAVLREFRGLYTSEVVNVARKNGVKITHNYESQEGAIPLPATLSMRLGNRVDDQGIGVKTKLYSPYPFPWRRDSGGLRDLFAVEAWKQLAKNPDEPVARVEEVDGHLSMRYATADRMLAGCVQCHNTHPDTPKVDWKVGDVRGVLEVIYPLDAAVAQSRANLRGTAILLVALGVLVLVGIAIAFGGLRRTAFRAQCANRQLVAREQELRQQNTQLTAAKAEAELTSASLSEHSKNLDEARKAAMSMMQDMEIARREAQASTQAKK